MGEYSDEEHEKANETGERWYDTFEKSDSFKTLHEKHQLEARGIVKAFTDYMYSYQGQTPKEWDSADMEEVCLNILPRKVSAEASFFEAVAPVLEAFFIFLDQSNIKENAGEMAKTVKPLKEEIIKNAGDPENWGMAKSFFMLGQGLGYDLADKKEAGEFINEYNENISQIPKRAPIYLPETFVRTSLKVGRNERCPCGSGKKFKRCCGNSPEAAL